MNHGKKINKLGRVSEHRTALLRNLSCQLLVHGYIMTTLAKAKALRPFFEKIVTKGVKIQKHGISDQRLTLIRHVSSDIQQTEAYQYLVRVWGIVCLDRPGGYTRIVKLGRRKGDGAEMAYIGIVISDELIAKYELSNKAFLSRFRWLAEKLIGDPLPKKNAVELWRNEFYPTVVTKSGHTRNKKSLWIEISFSASKMEQDSTWPIYQGDYIPLPLMIDLDCPESNHLSFQWDRQKNSMEEVPVHLSNRIKVTYRPFAGQQLIAVKLRYEESFAKDRLPHYCVVTIYGPRGTIFQKNIITHSAKLQVNNQDENQD